MTDNPNAKVDARDDSFKDAVARERAAAEKKQKEQEESASSYRAAYQKVCASLSDFAKLTGNATSPSADPQFKELLTDVVCGMVKEAVRDLEAVNFDITNGRALVGHNQLGQPVYQDVQILKLTFNNQRVQFEIKMDKPAKKPADESVPKNKLIH